MHRAEPIFNGEQPNKYRKTSERQWKKPSFDAKSSIPLTHRSQRGLPKFGGDQPATIEIIDQSVSCVLFKSQIDKLQAFGKEIKDPIELL